MAAQGSSSSVICPFCSAHVSANALTCPDCGAPINGGTLADAESAVYPDIARANLSRMRGDFKAAEGQLLAVLRRFPNNPIAQEMMGDLALERDDSARALEWYEMAFAIDPNSPALAKKLKSARGEITDQQTDETVQQLGIDRKTTNSPVLIAMIILAVIVVGVSAFYLGTAKARQPVADRPIKVITAEPQPSATNPKSEADTSQPPPERTQRGPQGSDDITLLQALQAKAADGGSVLAVRHDPRSRSVIVDFKFPQANGRELAARIAKDTLAADPTSITVTVRGISAGALVYIADVHKNRIDEIQTDAWNASHPDNPSAWVDHVLSNEWPAPSGGAVEPPPNSSDLPTDPQNSVSPPVESTGSTG